MEETLSTDNHKLIEEYKSQLSEQERLVLEIAIDHLETSFDIEKSIGFKNWKIQYANKEKGK